MLHHESKGKFSALRGDKTKEGGRKNLLQWLKWDTDAPALTCGVYTNMLPLSVFCSFFGWRKLNVFVCAVCRSCIVRHLSNNNRSCPLCGPDTSADEPRKVRIRSVWSWGLQGMQTGADPEQKKSFYDNEINKTCVKFYLLCRISQLAVQCG